MASTTGTRCAVPNCTSKQRDKHFSLFRIPKDRERATQWLTKCGLEHLIGKPSEWLYKNYRICALHFEERMYANDLRNRLLPTAVPTIFIVRDEQYQQPQLQQQISQQTQLQEVEAIPSTSAQMFPGILTVDISSILNNESSRLHSPTFTQTPLTLTANTPKKRKLKEKVNELRKKIRTKETTTAKSSVPTIEDFDKMCDQFLPESLAQYVKIQARLHLRKPQGRRYS